jgi:hypothetical protein
MTVSVNDGMVVLTFEGPHAAMSFGLGIGEAIKGGKDLLSAIIEVIAQKNEKAKRGKE